MDDNLTPTRTRKASGGESASKKVRLGSEEELLANVAVVWEQTSALEGQHEASLYGGLSVDSLRTLVAPRRPRRRRNAA